MFALSGLNSVSLLSVSVVVFPVFVTQQHLPVSAGRCQITVVSSPDPWLLIAAILSALENHVNMAECLAFLLTDI